jgi:hypothetical protein
MAVSLPPALIPQCIVMSMQRHYTAGQLDQRCERMHRWGSESGAGRLGTATSRPADQKTTAVGATVPHPG